ncbi:MAG: hypothetical protein HC927_06195 [Deltaproteobacteria bacterium]|nr:hypothetical protein [Deltaproteobacteria bacterium]
MLEVGIATGCTISVILFSAAMNLIVKSVEKMSHGPVTISGVCHPPTRAFMDDMKITARSVPEGRWMLEDLERLISWARMKFKPAKSRSLVLKKGKVQDRFRFKIQGERVPTVTEQPVKSLGKWFRSSLSDKDSMKEMRQQVDGWMNAVDKSGLPGKFKAWIYQHGVLPRLLWPLLVYNVPLTTVEPMEKRLNGYIRRWLGVPRSFSSIGLYSSGSKLQLPLSSVTEEYKVTKARQVMMLRDSADVKVSGARVEVNTGRKWRADKAVQDAESKLRHGDIVGTTTSGRLGLGCVTRASWKAASVNERRKMVQSEIRSTEEETRQAAATAMKKQGSWLRAGAK